MHWAYGVMGGLLVGWILYRLREIRDYVRTNEARTDAIYKAITGQNFPK